MVEVLALFILCFVFLIGCCIAIITYLKYSTRPLFLIKIYLLSILSGSGIIAINYWHLYRLNNMTVPFIVTSGGELKFNFIPQYNGDYSIDITFLNKEMNKKIESCNLSSSLEKDCDNELIYREINADISNYHFIGQLKYPDTMGSNISWGSYNSDLTEPALNIYRFHGVKNVAVPVHIKIAATREEIQLAKPIIFIGPLLDVYREGTIFTIGGQCALLISFFLPFIFLVILLFLLKSIIAIFAYLFKKKK
jgi:hypothetical protein